MIRIAQQPEPKRFHDEVRGKGSLWLSSNGIPPDRHSPAKLWKNRQYWTLVWEDFCIAYNGICAYTCLPVGEGGTIDHFKEKSKYPSLAYEWSNYRLAAFRINSRKKRKVIDPFQVPEEAFLLDVFTGEIYPNPEKDPKVQKIVRSTINSLGLDSELLRQFRRDWIDGYLTNEVTEGWVAKNAPFIHAELKRQNLL